MAALVEGVEYGLSSHSLHSANKSLLHVKLTDSALKAIEEFSSAKVGVNKKPTIQFDGSSGVIKLPSKRDDESSQVFRLSLQPYQGDTKGSFDCIQQKRHSSGEGLELLGSLTHKVSIHANEDSYKNTRERMALVEEQQKKSSAKEIKPSGPNIGKRVKIIKKNHSVNPPGIRPQDRLSPIDPVKSCYNTPAGSRYSTPRSVSPVPSQLKVPSHDQRSHNKTPTPVQQKPVPGQTAHTPAPTPPSSANSSQPTQNNSKPPPANPDLMRKTLRDRIIHLLALKPYKKPEIMVKLRMEGIRDKDKNQIGTVLKQVGVFNTRDNAYSLAKHLYSEVRADWPGYRDQDKQLLKKKQNPEEPPLSSTPPPTSVSPAVSPVHSIGSQGSPTSTQQKRPAGTCDDTGPYPKKQRIAHGPKKSSRPNSPSVQSLTPTPTPVVSQQPSKDCGNETKPDKGNLSISSSDQGSSRSHSEGKRSKTLNSSHGSGRKKEESRRKSYQATIKTQPQDMEVSQETNNNSKTDQENLDFINEYHKIESLEQRQKYKQSFNREYEEYRELHCRVEKVTRVFQELREQLYKEEEGSPTFETIKDKIVEEYKELKRDPDYTKNRQRCDYLHKKLAHIKRSILEFDNSKYGGIS